MTPPETADSAPGEPKATARDTRLDILTDLRERITTGKIQPGSHLTEATLAAEYALSRTPIRAALRALAGEGLIVIEPHRGAFIAEWTTADAAEVMEIRALLESHAASLAALRRTPEQLQQLTQLCEQMDQLERERPKNFRAHIAELNQHLHRLILVTAASPRLFNIAKDLASAPVMSESIESYSEAEMRRTLKDHRQIVAALTDGDSDLARALMEGHLRTSHAALMHNWRPAAAQPEDLTRHVSKDA